MSCGLGTVRRWALARMLTRDLLPALEAAGFARAERERFSIEVPLLSPHIAGVATR